MVVSKLILLIPQKKCLDGNSSRTGYPLHAFYSPQFIPEVSFLYEFCSCHRNLIPVVGIQLPMNTNLFPHLLCLVQSFLFEVIDFCHKNTKVLSQETFLVTRTFVLFQEFESM